MNQFWGEETRKYRKSSKYYLPHLNKYFSNSRTKFIFKAKCPLKDIFYSYLDSIEYHINYHSNWNVSMFL